MLPPGGANRKALSSNCEYLSGPLGVGTLIEEVPHPSMNVPECVSRSLNHLQSCATPRSKALAYPPVNSRVAAEVEGVSLIDPTSMGYLSGLDGFVGGSLDTVAGRYRNLSPVFHVDPGDPPTFLTFGGRLRKAGVAHRLVELP